VTRQQEQLILRLWRDWCKVWPEQYGHSSLDVKAEGYDPVFDVIPSQAYKDFYLEVVCDHPSLRHLNVFEVVDTALNQSRAPEASTLEALAEKRARAHAERQQTKTTGAEGAGPARANDRARVADVDVSLPQQSPPGPDEQQAESA